LEVPLEQASAAAELTAKLSARGVIIVGAEQKRGTVAELRNHFPKLAIMLLDPNGKQPMMRGQTITTEKGVLQVSSPTAQPWLDSNLPLARFEQEFDPAQPPVYSFAWQAGDALQQARGVSAEDMCLAVLEAAAIRSDLVLPIDERLQTKLLQNDPAAWAIWNKVKSCVSFGSDAAKLEPLANVGVVTSDYDTAYEPMNLMGRHNIPYRVLRAGTIGKHRVEGLSVLAVFTAPDAQDAAAMQEFASSGGTVVLVNVTGKYPWQSLSPLKTAEQALSYKIGKGQVIELAEPVTDPETFAQDVRRLIPKDDLYVSAWNALTTLAIPYTVATGESIVELVNYSKDPLRVQVRVKGAFGSVRYEAPGKICCDSLTPVKTAGFTEFIVPSLEIAGRVHLRAAPEASH
jgi:hypothetical protein